MNEIPLHLISDDSEALDVKIDSTLARLRERKAKLLEIMRLKRENEILARAAIHEHVMQNIVEVVEEEFHVGFEALSSKSRETHIVIPRHVAFYIARTHTDLTLKSIGKTFGRDHKTVMHACKNIQALIDTDKEFATRTKKVLGRLKLAK